MSFRVDATEGGWAVVEQVGVRDRVVEMHATEGAAAHSMKKLNAEQSVKAQGEHGLHKIVNGDDHKQGCVCNRGAFLPGDEDLVCPIHGKVYG